MIFSVSLHQNVLSVVVAVIVVVSLALLIYSILTVDQRHQFHIHSRPFMRDYKYVYTACAHSNHSRVWPNTIHSLECRKKKTQIDQIFQSAMKNKHAYRTVQITPFWLFGICINASFWSLRSVLCTLYSMRNIKTISIFIDWFWHTNLHTYKERETDADVVFSYHSFWIWVSMRWAKCQY